MNLHHTKRSFRCAAIAGLSMSLGLAQEAALAPSGAEAAAEPRQTLSAMRPSRQVGPEEIGTYLQYVQSRLDIASRSVDPFGQVQDPNAKAEIKKPTLTTRRPTRMKATSFDEIIERIEISAIMPAENRFLIGGRSFRLGDQFPIAFRGRNHEVKVIGVSASKIDFEKIETGEVSSVKLNMLPPGMQQGSDGITAPGFNANDSNTPLQIDGSPAGPGF